MPPFTHRFRRPKRTIQTPMCVPLIVRIYARNGTLSTEYTYAAQQHEWIDFIRRSIADKNGVSYSQVEVVPK